MSPSTTQAPGFLPAQLVGFWSVDAASLAVTLDPPISGLLGIGVEAGLAGVSESQLLQRIHPDDRVALSLRVRQAIDRRGHLVHTCRVAGLGITHWVRAVGRCFADGQGRATHLSGMLVDLGAQATPLPQAQLVDSLVIARDIALAAEETLVARLVEAVLLEAGRSLAATLRDESDLPEFG